MSTELEKFLWRNPSLMWLIALVVALAFILGLMWATGELPENPMNSLNVRREGVGIPRQ